MICEKCKGKMNWSIEGATQGWRCPMCGWNIITTYIEDIDRDETEYSLYIKNVTEVDAEKIKFVAKTANVNFVIVLFSKKANPSVVSNSVSFPFLVNKHFSCPFPTNNRNFSPNI